MNKKILLELLADAFAEEVEHLKLRLIRENQEPRFEALKKTHPEIYADFMKARNSCHEKLLRIRRKRQRILTRLIET